MALAQLGEAGGRRGQGLNSGLGELKSSKHKADVALPRLRGNQRHMLPLVWQHMCAVHLQDPRCLLFFFLFKPIQSETLAPALCSPTTWSLSPTTTWSISPKDQRQGCYQQFLTKRARQCPFETSSRSPPGLELSLPLNPARSNTASGNYLRDCSTLATTQLLAAA